MTQKYIHLNKEADGSYGDGGADSYTLFLKAGDISFNTEQDFAEIEEINRPTLEEAYPVARTGGGSFSMWGRANALPLLLWGLFGGYNHVDVGSGGVAPYQTNFIPDTPNLPSLEISEGADNNEYGYPGQLIDNMEFTAEAGDVMGIDVETTGIAATTTRSKQTPVYIDPDTCPIFTLKNATIDLGGSSRADLRSLNVSISNSISDDEHTLGSLDLQEKPPAQRREIEVEMEFKDEDSEIWQDFVDGTEAALEATFQTDAEIEEGYPYELTFLFPRIQYRETTMDQSGRDPIRTNVSGRALFERGYEYDIGDGTTATADTEIIAQLVHGAADQLDTA